MVKRNDMNVQIYTIQDLKKWLYEGVSNNLTYDLISNARATAIIQNTYAEDSSPALAVAYDEQGKAIGYTAVFADKWHNELIYWGTTGYIDSSMRGKGVGTELYSSMMKACNGRWYAFDSSPAALAISKKIGLNICYFDRYYLSYEYSHTIKARIRSLWVNWRNQKILSKLRVETHLELIHHIDLKTFAFIEQHSGGDLFPRSLDALNWILKNPFISCAPSDLSSYNKYEFSTSLSQYNIYAFRIEKGIDLIGFAMFRLCMGDLVLLYLYKEDKYIDDVYSALIKHILTQKLKCFRTFDADLIEYYNRLEAISMNQKSRVQRVSLSIPANVKVDMTCYVQGGDGDMFC